jgi:hypothetical protein
VGFQLESIGGLTGFFRHVDCAFQDLIKHLVDPAVILWAGIWALIIEVLKRIGCSELLKILRAVGMAFLGVGAIGFMVATFPVTMLTERVDWEALSHEELMATYKSLRTRCDWSNLTPHARGRLLDKAINAAAREKRNRSTNKKQVPSKETLKGTLSNQF